MEELGEELVVDKSDLKMMNGDLLGRSMRCSVCGGPIPSQKARKKAVVCSEECKELRTRWFRQFKDDRQCRFCKRPSTYTQRRAFSRFEAWEAEHPDLAYPKVWRVLSERGITLEQFSRATSEAHGQDFSFEFTPLTLQWRRFPNPKLPHENLESCIGVLQDFWAEREARKLASGDGGKEASSAHEEAGDLVSAAGG